MVFFPHPGVLVLAGGMRRGSYAQRRSIEHDVLAREMRDCPRFREELLESAAVTQAMLLARLGGGSPSRLALRLLAALAAPARALCVRLGIHPKSPYARLRYGKGGATKRHRLVVGLGADAKGVRAIGRQPTTSALRDPLPLREE
jgi:hypothetical protein